MKRLLTNLNYATRGRKTYVTALGAVLFAVLGLVYGYLPTQEAIEIILAALGAAGLRHAIGTNL